MRVGLVHRDRHEGCSPFLTHADLRGVPSGSGSDRRKEQQRVIERSESVLQDTGGAFVERSAGPGGGGGGGLPPPRAAGAHSAPPPRPPARARARRPRPPSRWPWPVSRGGPAPSNKERDWYSGG